MENKIICMRGHAERKEEVRGIFLQNGALRCEYNCLDEEVIYYIDPLHEVVCIAVKEDKAYNKLIPHLTELPPLEEKVKEIEFWLRPTDPVVVRDDENCYWDINIFGNYNKYEFYSFRCIRAAWSTCLPFNKETEKLIGTKDKPKERYVFKGVKAYFE